MKKSTLLSNILTIATIGVVAGTSVLAADINISNESKDLKNQNLTTPYNGWNGAATGAYRITSSFNTLNVYSTHSSQLFTGVNITSETGVAEASYNSLWFMSSGSDMRGKVSGAIVQSTGGNVFASSNSVMVLFGSFGAGIVGGEVNLGTAIVGAAQYASATGNSVTLSGNEITVNGGIYGGVAQGAAGVNVNANENMVTIASEAVANGDIVGGLIKGTEEGKAINNTVTIGNKANLVGAALFGGKDDSAAGTSEVFTGNTLMLDKYTRANATVQSIQNFENLEFILSKSTKAGDTLLTVTSSLNLENADSSATTSVTRILTEDGFSIVTGGVITLLGYGGGVPSGIIANNGEIVGGQEGSFVLQEWKVNQTATGITATAVGSKMLMNGPVESVSKTSLGAISLANIGGDLIAGEGIASALENAGKKASGDVLGNSSLAAFAAVSGGAWTYHGSDYIDLDSVSFVGGLSHKRKIEKGDLVIGAFLETGYGSFEGRNRHSTSETHASGDMNNFGGGVLARFDFAKGKYSPYIEGSARVGKTDTEYKNNLTDPVTGDYVDYDTDAMYYGMHIGGGFIQDIGSDFELDLSGKYFWVQQEDHREIIGGNTFDFDAVNSHRFRIGAEISHNPTDINDMSFRPYFGLAYEYELDGETALTVSGLPLENDASLNGSTGIARLGATLSHENGFSVDVNVQGSAGKREGFAGMAKLTYEF